MSKVSVLIIEDDPQQSAALSAMLEQHNYEVAGIAASFKEGLELLQHGNVDIALIDVFLGNEPDGIRIAETMNTVDSLKRPFVFLTSSRDRHVFEQGKQTRPHSYLLKPYNELEVLYALEMAFEKFYEAPSSLTGEQENVVLGSDTLLIKKQKRLVKVSVGSITHVKVEDRYCNLYTDSERFVVQLSLVKAQELLESFRFIRAHRNYLVNTDHIREIDLEDELIFLDNGEIIPIGEQYRKDWRALRSL